MGTCFPVSPNPRTLRQERILHVDLEEPEFNPELDKNLRAALSEPSMRIGTVHKVERTFPYGEEYPPFICFTFSWMEPDDDETKTPQVVAMDLHIPDILLCPIMPTLNSIAPGTVNRPPQRQKPNRRPRRKR